MTEPFTFMRQHEDIFRALEEIIDPEIGCNIVDLGLIYDVRVEAGRVTVTMTLTSPGCPMHECLIEGVKVRLEAVDGVASVDVVLVWDPPWHPSMMSERGRGVLAGAPWDTV